MTGMNSWTITALAVVQMILAIAISVRVIMRRPATGVALAGNTSENRSSGA